jgi:hypothetical protein
MLFADAVQFFWSIRSKGSVEQPADFAGRRGEVVGGKHCDGFLLAIRKLLVDAGLDEASIYFRRTEIPGFFRQAKAWDLLVVIDGKLRAAVEIKSQVGPSFGNNCNNRAEEAIGNAADLWTAFREGGYRDSPAPFVGYVFLLEECEKSVAPTRAPEPHFDVFPEFKSASYAERYEELCRRLVAERLYTAATLLLSEPASATARPNYRVAAPDLSVERFCDQLLRHVAPL